MRDWTEGRVELGGVSLRYLRGGEGPPIVLAHGVSDSAECWGAVAEDLAADHTVVAYDARFHGRSAAPESGHGSGDLADDLAGLCAALGLERPVLMGHSMGAETCAVAAAANPGLARALLLEDPPWRSGERDPAEIDAVVAWLEGLHRHDRAALIAMERAQGRDWPDDEWGPWAEAKHRVSPRIGEWVRGLRGDWRAAAAALTCPTLVLAGDPALGGIVDAEVAAEIARLVPGGRVVTIAGAGHSVRRDRRAAYLGAVRAFLAEVEA